MRLFDEYLAEYRARRALAAPNPLDITYNQAMSRPRPSEITRAELTRLLSDRHARRFARMQGDMIWLRRKLIHLGVDPDQARWLV